MKEIKFNIPLHLNESIKNVKKFLDSKKPLHGPGKNILRIKDEVKNKFGFKTTHLTYSCTSALEISALLLNLKKDDEVVVPSFSFITTASSFARTGCRLRFCDIEQRNLMPSFSQIKKCINKRTKAIVIVHYQGFSIDYLDKLQIFCKKKNIILIEDAAQGFGSYFKNKPLGSFGDLACFSFHETKNLHSGLGGMLVVNNKKFIDRSYLIFDKGTDRHLVQTNKKKYYSWVELGSSFLLSEFAASYLLPQILYFRRNNIVRSKLYNRYLYNFKDWHKDQFFLTNIHRYKYNFHAFVILLKNNKREHFLKYLKKNKINAVISYTPLHRSKAGKKYQINKPKLINADKYINRIVRLPLHNYLKNKEIDYISEKIKQYFNRY